MSLIRLAVKELRFQQRKIKRAEERALKRNMNRLLAFIRTRAKSSIRKRKKSAEPGRPPSSHTGDLKRNIFFAYEQDRRGGLVGPVKLPNKQGGGSAPRLLEKGGKTVYGEYLVNIDDGLGRGEKGRFTSGKKLRRIQARLNYRGNKFMEPAMKQELNKVSSIWQNSIK